jgi:anti-anti-sigma factor
MAANTVRVPRPLTFEIEADDQQAVVKCSGDLTYDGTASFKSHVKPLLSECMSVVLDFSDVTYMDSSGLGVLVGVYASARGAGRELRLINVQPRVYDLLRLTRLLPIFGLT